MKNNVGAVITAHNAEHTIERAIRSTLAQAYYTVVVNDSGYDKTHDVAIHLRNNESLYDELDIIISGSDVRLGVCAVRNIGLSNMLSRCNLIICLDADEVLLPGAVDALLSAYTPGSFVYGNWIERHAERKPAPIGMIDRKNIACSTFLFEREAWLKVGGYNPRYEIGGEDWAFMCALLNAGYQPRYVDAPIHTYTPTPGGRSHKMLPYIDTIRAMLKEDYATGLQLAKRGLQKTV